jgi:adenylyl-sulfate kinase
MQKLPELETNHEDLKFQKKGMVFWFTGLSGAGKTTLANLVNKELLKLNYRSLILDGDVIRKGLNKDLAFSDEDRLENNRRIAELAKLLIDEGFVIFVCCISPFENDRHLNRQICGAGNYFEVYIDCPLEVCEKRDVKDLYRKARLGLIKNFTGIDSPYEVPGAPDIIVKTYNHNVNESAKDLSDFVLQILRS